MPRTLGLALGRCGCSRSGPRKRTGVQGTISDIDPIARSITVDGQSYRMPDATTAGVSLDELKVGEKVEIILKPLDEGQDACRRAMMVKKLDK
jgi:hypothetical protein